jgi:hypothetical protein
MADVQAAIAMQIADTVNVCAFVSLAQNLKILFQGLAIHDRQVPLYLRGWVS